MRDDGEDREDFEFGNWLGLLQDIDAGKYEVPEFMKTMVMKILAVWGLCII